MSDKKYNIAIVGATGVVGEVILSLLHEREFPVGDLYVLASEHSAGKKLLFGTKSLMVTDVATFDFSKADYVFFTAGSEVSKSFVSKATEAGCLVIDNTSAFRYDDDVPLIVPEINAALLAQLPERRIISNPNCSTIQMAVVLNPIIEHFGVRKVIVSTYQSVSGAGRSAIEELARQTATLMNGQEVEVSALPQQIAFNVIPEIDSFEENGFTREEMKMLWETQKIFNNPSLQVNATAVRVPVFYGHSESLHIQLEREASLAEIENCLDKAIGVTLMKNEYPMPTIHAQQQNDVYVGRVRQDLADPTAFNCWVVSDNVRKGAALNAVQIAELLVNRERVMH
jgi:aspartate-semialdehyde dehydrogenase